MAGINLPSVGSESNNDFIISYIKSRDFVKHLITFDDVLPNIMASKGYNMTTKSIIYDSEIYDLKTRKWVRKVKSSQSIIPSYLEAHKKYLEDIILIYEDDDSKFITLSVEHHSPIFAELFLNLIIDELNFYMKEKALNESDKAISFLKPELNTPIVELQSLVASQIASQLKIQMIANSRDEYFVKYIDPPFIPDKKYKPKRAIICILGTILGFILSVIFVVTTYFIRILKHN
jgi:hypothetical protein